MFLIADSGSTKAHWALVVNKKLEKQVITKGFNPYFVSTEDICTLLEKELLPFIPKEGIKNVYFYGAGCSSEAKNAIVESALKKTIQTATIFVDHDLLGAARALFNSHEGIACILGTGSNSCYYDGKDIKENIFSLGYFFGDEGGGVHLGKTLMRYYLKNELPSDLRNAFQKRYSFTTEQILDSIYNKPNPNRFLATFSEFCSEHKTHAFVIDLIKKCFREFFVYQVTQYSNYKKVNTSYVGSVGHVYKDLLVEVAKEFDVKVKDVVRSPMDGLVDYHIKNI